MVEPIDPRIPIYRCRIEDHETAGVRQTLELQGEEEDSSVF